ncbi:hypothetical protein VTI28DRAFT_5663 [Corynascus sepedonium]
MPAEHVLFLIRYPEHDSPTSNRKAMVTGHQRPIATWVFAGPGNVASATFIYTSPDTLPAPSWFPVALVCDPTACTRGLVPLRELSILLDIIGSPSFANTHRVSGIFIPPTFVQCML